MSMIKLRRPAFTQFGFEITCTEIRLKVYLVRFFFNLYILMHAKMYKLGKLTCGLSIFKKTYFEQSKNG